MNKIIIGLLLALSIATPSLAEKVNVEVDHCMLREEIITNVTTNVPDAHYKSLDDMLIFSAPSHEDNFVAYFDENGCYIAYDIVTLNAG